MSTLHSTERIGEAWRLHRNADNEGAIQIFQEIISTSPENVDAYYGLGLAYKASGNIAAATAAFRQALDYAQQANQAIQITSKAEGHHGTNDLDTSEDDRFMMLSRMLSQRLEELGADA